MSGSSPLALGKLEGVHADLPDVRLIPAYTGKTPHWSRWTKSGRAHPRSRGENDTPFARAVTHAGSSLLTRGKHTATVIASLVIDSSPRTREKHLDTEAVRPLNGLIPAHARKTVPCRLVWPCWWAHPSSCGENCASGPSAQGISGSSPLTRGKHVRSDVDVVAAGLIPAHAGKTVRRRRTLRSRRAHPCSRRENSTFSTPVGSMSGSSPLTRGRLG